MSKVTCEPPDIGFFRQIYTDLPTVTVGEQLVGIDSAFHSNMPRRVNIPRSAYIAA